jgi:plasmid stabilization system protein ParE
MKIKYRPAAIKDIQKTSDYLAEVLNNPSAAMALRKKILQSVSLLKENPFMGTSLSSKYDGLETDIRFLVVRKQMIFYEPHDEWIEIIRVLDGRMDYMAQLFLQNE